jgi:hypothetical protein
MSWGITFKTEIELLRMSFNSIEEVKDKVKENDSLINSLEIEIKMFTSSNPKDIIPNDWNEQPIDWINNQITEKLNLLHEYIIENFKLSCYIEYLEEQTII